MKEILDKEHFIKKAKKVHQNKYKYINIKYKSAHDKVSITCILHGDFEQTPYSHLRGQGCPLCARAKNSNKMRKTKDKFISEANERHNNKYNYSQVNYINNKEKVCIICPVHGEFWQAPNSHLSGRGCKECSFDNFRTKKKEFIKKANRIHNNKYDYSQVNYINNRKKVCIICPVHGEFWQNPDSHINKKCGCYKCSNSYPLTKESFIKKANEIHNCIYNYEKVKYINNHTKVIIICSEHGVFKQTPQKHLSGNKCPKCSDHYQMTKRDFIKKARKVHGFRYDYTKSKYKKVKEDIKIICKKHGSFYQQPDNHLQGRGCPFCTRKSEAKVKKLLKKYFKNWEIISNKKIWNKYKNYNHRRFCDFWLEKDGIKIMVEYDGQQHFKPVRFNGMSIKNAQKIFKETKIKDKLDSEFCIENNIILHRIKYDESKEESIKKLKDIIKSILEEKEEEEE